MRTTFCHSEVLPKGLIVDVSKNKPRLIRAHLSPCEVPHDYVRRPGEEEEAEEVEEVEDVAEEAAGMVRTARFFSQRCCGQTLPRCLLSSSGMQCDAVRCNECKWYFSI